MSLVDLLEWFPPGQPLGWLARWSGSHKVNHGQPDSWLISWELIVGQLIQLNQLN